MTEPTRENYGADWRSSIAGIEAEAFKARARLKKKLRGKLGLGSAEPPRGQGIFEKPTFPWRGFEPPAPKSEPDEPKGRNQDPEVAGLSPARRAATSVAYIWLGYSLFRVGMMTAATAMAGGVPTATGSDDLICLASVLAGFWFLRPK